MADDYPRPKHWRNPGKVFDPLRTCPSTRHAAMIADELRDKKSALRKLLTENGYEPEHMASSIEAVVMGLWHARQWMKWEELPPTKRYRYNGHWVPTKRRRHP